MIFSNLKGKESGRGTPVEKLSLEMEEEGEYVLPPIDTNSGEEYFRKLQLHQDGISIRCVRKLVESSYYLCLETTRLILVIQFTLPH